jgi:hypothetical protein
MQFAHTIALGSTLFIISKSFTAVAVVYDKPIESYATHKSVKRVLPQDPSRLHIERVSNSYGVLSDICNNYHDFKYIPVDDKDYADHFGLDMENMSKFESLISTKTLSVERAMRADNGDEVELEHTQYRCYIYCGTIVHIQPLDADIDVTELCYETNYIDEVVNKVIKAKAKLFDDIAPMPKEDDIISQHKEASELLKQLTSELAAEKEDVEEVNVEDIEVDQTIPERE